jgi:Fur family ferric uptake transcriptional regulator
MTSSLVDRLRDAGYRVTEPRRVVLRVLENAGQHLSPAEILQRGRAIYPDLGRATVYRTLDLLTELGILRPIYLGQGGSRIARVEGGHHHLVCLACGSAISFNECPVQDMKQALAQRFGFQVKGHMLELYGLCKNCR